MRSIQDSSTSATLLGRLKNSATDEEAWVEFVRRYGPQIESWARHWPCCACDPEDITQRVLIKLLQAMKTFKYNPQGNFRAWLKEVVHNVALDVCDEAGPRERVGTDAAQFALDCAEAREDLNTRLATEYDLELLGLAHTHVRMRVAPVTWEAYCLSREQPCSVQEIAERLGIPVSAVYVARSRILKMLEEEVRLLDRPE